MQQYPRPKTAKFYLQAFLGAVIFFTLLVLGIIVFTYVFLIAVVIAAVLFVIGFFVNLFKRKTPPGQFQHIYHHSEPPKEGRVFEHNDQQP